jgi:hypothetical protein
VASRSFTTVLRVIAPSFTTGYLGCSCGTEAHSWAFSLAGLSRWRRARYAMISRIGSTASTPTSF